jgi:hypothetical protein
MQLISSFYDIKNNLPLFLIGRISKISIHGHFIFKKPPGMKWMLNITVAIHFLQCRFLYYTSQYCYTFISLLP